MFLISVFLLCHYGVIILCNGNFSVVPLRCHCMFVVSVFLYFQCGVIIMLVVSLWCHYYVCSVIMVALLC